MKKVSNTSSIKAGGTHCIEGGRKKLLKQNSVLGGPATRWSH